MSGSPPISTRFYYGWIVVVIAFVTLGIAVNARTAFSLLYPPILDEFGWERGLTAAIFSIGFIASTASVPFIGMLMDRYGPRFVLPVSAIAVATGFLLSTVVATPVGFYLSLGLLAIGAGMPMTYIGHSMFLPNWFVRRRGLALGISFSGVGVIGLFLFPALQALIVSMGWRAACIALAAACVLILIPLNLVLQRGRPEEIGLEAGGAGAVEASTSHGPVVVDEPWASREWTLAAAAATARFWWIAAGYFLALYAWYAVQVHQTRYFLDIGIGGSEAAFALGLVAATGVVGQIGIGHFSDRFGREWGWSLALAGFMMSGLVLIAMHHAPSRALLYLAVGTQGFLGYGLASLFGPIPAEIFAGRRYATILGALSVTGNLCETCPIIQLTGFYGS